MFTTDEVTEAPNGMNMLAGVAGFPVEMSPLPNLTIPPLDDPVEDLLLLQSDPSGVADDDLVDLDAVESV